MTGGIDESTENSHRPNDGEILLYAIMMGLAASTWVINERGYTAITVLLIATMWAATRRVR